MKSMSLSRKMLTQFVVCIAVLLLFATPLFYFLTKNYYAEDMIDIIEAVGQGKPVPPIDLEEDIMEGITLQFGVIAFVLAGAIIITLSLISNRLWRPFDKTLRIIEGFRLEDGTMPQLPESNIREFNRLNNALQKLMGNSMTSYKTQKEFTENASHELQTPLAVFQSKLDLLLQRADITEGQAELIQALYDTSKRLAALNRNLLLLAKIDNNQYRLTENVCLNDVVNELLPFLKNVSGDIVLKEDFRNASLMINANRTLLESLLNNLVVNAVRHNRRDGEITITVEGNRLTVSNTSDRPPLDGKQIFNRFYRPQGQTKGNGLGLAIVKAICSYHGWQVEYNYCEKRHCFTVIF